MAGNWHILIHITYPWDYINKTHIINLSLRYLLQIKYDPIISSFSGGDGFVANHIGPFIVHVRRCQFMYFQSLLTPTGNWKRECWVNNSLDEMFVRLLSSLNDNYDTLFFFPSDCKCRHCWQGHQLKSMKIFWKEDYL